MLVNEGLEQHYVVSMAFMGAPGVVGEMLLSGRELVDALACMKDLYDVGDITDQGRLRNTGNYHILTFMKNIKYFIMLHIFCKLKHVCISYQLENKTY